MENTNAGVGPYANRLTDKDCFYISDRHSKLLAYPTHCHPEYELNFTQNGEGARRIIGDSCETIGNWDLVLITGKDLRHVWERDACTSDDVREITIHFSSNLFFASFINKTHFHSIQQMLEKARRGLAFPREAIDRVYSLLDGLSTEEQGFYAVIHFMTILYELSLCEEARTLSTNSLAGIHHMGNSNRLNKIEDYVEAHYMQEVRLADLAGMVGMTSVSFSRFFRQVTGQTFSDYLIQVRLTQAARLLVDSGKTVADVCFDCGFNNLSNFNRLFKKNKSCSPKEFRERYRKRKIVI